MRKGWRWEPNAKLRKVDGRLTVHELSESETEERESNKKKKRDDSN